MGLFFKSKSVVVQAAENDVSVFRVGFTASKKVGGAVVRNRAKRRMRAAVDASADLLLDGVDYVFIARRFVCKVAWGTLLQEIRSAMVFLNKKVSRNAKAGAAADQIV